jgi:hypothetical protein
VPVPAARAARAEPLGDLLGDLAAGQVGSEQAGRGDRAGGAGAVGDDHRPAQAQQDGAAVALRIQPRGELAQAATLQEGAEPCGRGGGDRGPQLGRGEPDRAFQRLQRHVPGEAVGHDHVDVPGQQVTALHVAREGQRERAVRWIGGQQLVGPPGELVALAGFGPDGEQPHPRGADPQRELGVGHPELAELHQHLRLGVGGGPGVDEHRAAGPGRQHHGQPGPRHVGQRPQPQPGRGDHAGGRARRDHRRRVAAPDQLAGHGHARPRAPQAGQRALVHGQVVLGGHDGQLVGPGAHARLGQRLAQARGRPGQQDPDAVLALGGQRARDDLVGGVVAAHGVDGQHRTAGPGHQVPGPVRAPRAAAAFGRALGSALVRPGRGPPLRTVRGPPLRTVRGPPLRTVRGRAQRVTQGVSGRDDASSFVSFGELWPCDGPV